MPETKKLPLLQPQGGPEGPAWKVPQDADSRDTTALAGGRVSRSPLGKESRRASAGIARQPRGALRAAPEQEVA